MIDPNILVDKPTIKGTRLAVEFIIDLLAEGWSEFDILSNYPGLTAQDIQACLAYASWTLKTEKVVIPKACEYMFCRSGMLAIVELERPQHL